MSPRQLILLSPYQLPAQNPLMIGSEETAAFLNDHSALWHLAALLVSRKMVCVHVSDTHEILHIKMHSKFGVRRAADAQEVARQAEIPR
jgi:hypothetical protein